MNPDGLAVCEYRFELVGDTGSGIVTADGGTVVLDGEAWEEDGVFYQKVIYTPAAEYNNDTGVSDTWDSFQFRFGVSVWEEETTVDDNFDGARCIYTADLDGDGDLDIIGAAEDDNEIGVVGKHCRRRIRMDQTRY